MEIIKDYEELDVCLLAFELQQEHWLKTALKCGYIVTEEYQKLVSKFHKIGQKLGRMVIDADKWCARF